MEEGTEAPQGGTARVPRQVRTTYQEASTESDTGGGRGPRPEWTTSRSVVKGGARGAHLAAEEGPVGGKWPLSGAAGQCRALRPRWWNLKKGSQEAAETAGQSSAWWPQGTFAPVQASICPLWGQTVLPCPSQAAPSSHTAQGGRPASIPLL